MRHVLGPGVMLMACTAVDGLESAACTHKTQSVIYMFASFVAVNNNSRYMKMIVKG